MNSRIDELKRYSLFKHDKVQEFYELEIMSNRMAKQDAKEFNNQIKKNLSLQSTSVQKHNFKARL